jgi:hypothetical protein
MVGIMGESLKSSYLKAFCIRSWWVIVFSTLSVAFYFQAAHGRTTIFSDLTSRMQEMEREKFIVSQDQDELALQLQSETDPAWVEMLLMKELGVVPEGWTKVRFTK